MSGSEDTSTAGERREHRRSIADVEAAFDRKLQEHEVREQMRLALVIDDLKADAFPDGAEAHRAAHQAMIDAAKSQEEFWRGLKADIAKKSLFGIFNLLLFFLVAGIAAKLGLGSLVTGALPK